MTVSRYKRAEVNIINSAWNSLESFADSYDLSAGFNVRNALRIDKGERNSVTDSKAVLMGSFLAGYDNPDTPAHDIYSYAKGCIMLLVFGAHVSHTNKDVKTALTQLIDKLRKAKETHDGYIHRMLSEIKI